LRAIFDTQIANTVTSEHNISPKLQNCVRRPPRRSETKGKA